MKDCLSLENAETTEEKVEKNQIQQFLKKRVLLIQIMLKTICEDHLMADEEVLGAGELNQTMLNIDEVRYETPDVVCIYDKILDIGYSKS